MERGNEANAGGKDAGQGDDHALLQRVEPGVKAVEAGVDAVEASLNLLETLIDLLEAPVDLRGKVIEAIVVPVHFLGLLHRR